LYLHIFFNFLWFFVIYSIIGWISEVIFAAVKYRELVNRGFLNGPYCPIYGFGMLFVILSLSSFTDNVLILFLASALLTTALEAVVGVVLNKLFNKTWWDYSSEPFNIKGYVCIRASLTWGLCCVIAIKFVHPYIAKMVNIIPEPYSYIIIIVLTAFIILDLVSTVAVVKNFDKHLIHIEELAANIKEMSNELAMTIAGNAIEIIETGEEIKEAIEDKKNQIILTAKKRKESFTEITKKYENLITQKGKYTRLIKAFPDLKTGKYTESLQKLKDHARSKK